MLSHVRDFLTYIAKERNYSPHTVLAYEDDLEQFSAYLASRAPGKKIQPASVDQSAVR